MSTKDSVKSSGRRYAQMFSAGGIFRGGCGRNVAGQRATVCLLAVRSAIISPRRLLSSVSCTPLQLRVDVGPIEALVPTSVFKQDLGRRPAAKSLTRDEVPRIAACGACWRSWSWQQRSRRTGPCGGVENVKVRTSAHAGLDRITRVPLRLGHEDHQVRCDGIGRGSADLSVSSV